jgi:hypothetical protein
MTLILGVIIGVLLAGCGFLLLSLRKNKTMCRSVTIQADHSADKVVVTEDSSPSHAITKIGIGGNADRPAVTIEALPSTSYYDKAKPLDVGSKTVSRLGELFQAAPALLEAWEASGKRLMEVVVDGELVRAADGNGFRAFAMGGKGIKEQARLFDSANLQNMINAAAVWQFASVVVAQKHLADISSKLDAIKEGVGKLSRFLDNQRKARIQSSYDYLIQAYNAIESGDLPSSVRIQLESCERDMMEIERHLEMEYRQCAENKVQHKETFGTKELTADIASKIADLEQLTKDLGFCVKTRIAAWHVLSLYPGEPGLKEARRASLEQSIESLQSLTPCCTAVTKEISLIKSKCNLASTLKERRGELIGKWSLAIVALEHETQNSRAAIEQTQQLLTVNDRPTRMMLKFAHNTIADARLA